MRATLHPENIMMDWSMSGNGGTQESTLLLVLEDVVVPKGSVGTHVITGTMTMAEVDDSVEKEGHTM